MSDKPGSFTPPPGVPAEITDATAADPGADADTG
jgi:hypothetical protein